MDLQQKNVLILGLGESGLAMARWCLREGAGVQVADSRAEPPFRAALMEHAPNTSVHTGFLPSLLQGIDLVGISPGLAPHHEPQRDLLDAARAAGVPIWGEVEFFCQKLEQLARAREYAPRLIAVTGTNGKTTVTRLTALLCERAGQRVLAAGNIGPAALDALRQALDAEALPDIWVLELSSFQLATSENLMPSAAAILNITQDHLDWHDSIGAYAASKARILAPATIAVLNRNDPRVMATVSDDADRTIITFGIDAPDRAMSFGVIRDGGVRWLAYAQSEEAEASPRRSKMRPPESFVIKKLMPIDALQIRGDHNATNALAALALCRAIGLPLAPLLHGLPNYQGEPHRVELIASIAGVDYFDDSKGTNVGATVAALEGLGRRIVLIAGGDGKGQDFRPLAAPVGRHARAVVLIGKDAAAIRAAIEDAAVAGGAAILEAPNLADAVAVASRLAEAGDAVLLSPACASLDMFRNYRHRAEVFAKAVEHLGMEAPAPC